MAICHHQPPFTATFFKRPNLSPSSFRCNLSFNSQPEPEPEPIFTSVKSFAPATVANLGPGFDILGCAIDGIGDHVNVTIDPNVLPGRIAISEITGIHNPHKKPSKNPLWNCAGIAAISVMHSLKIRSVGLSLSIETGLPLRSGLGSSAASAAAAAVAVNAIFGGKLTETDLVFAALKAEAKLSGYHADNVAPAIMGGFVLIRSYDPLELVRLHLPTDASLWFVLVNPEFELQTKKMRAEVPSQILMSDHLWNCSQTGALVACVLNGDLVGFGKAMSSDKIVEPRRGKLIPGMEDVKKVANEGGAYGCTISGSGPTVVAITDSEEKGRDIGKRMVEVFMKKGKLKALAMVMKLDRVGARVITSIP